MTRLPLLTSRDEVPEPARETFDSITESRGSVRGPFALLMHSPTVAERAGSLGAYLRFESALPGPDRELATITAAREADCAYEWAAHVRLAREVGVREEAIDAVAHRRDVDGLEAGEALIVRYGRELLREHRVSDATYAAALERYGEQGVVDLTALMGYYSMIAAVLNAMQAVPAEGSPILPE